MANKRRSTVDKPQAEGNATGANARGQQAAQQQGSEGTIDQTAAPARENLADRASAPQSTAVAGQTRVFDEGSAE